MKLATKLLGTFTVWLLYGGMITMAIIYDGIYIQLCIDTAIMLLTGIGTFLYTKKKNAQS